MAKNHEQPKSTASGGRVAVILGAVVTVLALVSAATGYLKQTVDNIRATFRFDQAPKTNPAPLPQPGPVAKSSAAPSPTPDDGAALVVTELRIIPVWPQINGPKLWLQPQTDVSPEYLGYRIQATIKKNRAEAIASCDAQTMDKNEQPGYCIGGIDPFTAGVQHVIREVLCKEPSVTYTTKTKFRIVCTQPGVISPWYPIELPDRATAVEK